MYYLVSYLVISYSHKQWHSHKQYEKYQLASGINMKKLAMITTLATIQGWWLSNPRLLTGKILLDLRHLLVLWARCFLKQAQMTLVHKKEMAYEA